MSEPAKRNCPGCSSSKATLAGSKNGFEIFVCDQCLSIFTSRLPAPKEAEDYDAYYTEANLTVPDFILRRVGEIIEGFDKYKRNGRLLDIGFGAGTILEVAKRSGWDTFGQEVSEPATAQAREKGFRVFCGDLSDANYPEDDFDVVTCSEILEHLPEPGVVLREVRRILRPGGLFWATTPSARGISFRLLGLSWSVLSPPEHVQLYSQKGVSRMLQNAGFSKVTFKTHGMNPSELINFFRNRGDSPTGFSPVTTSYELNEKLSSNRSTKFIKAFLNAALNQLRMGDSLKIHAEK